LQFLAENLSYYEYLDGLKKLTYEQLLILMDRAIYEARQDERNKHAVKEIIEKHFPTKVGTSEYEPKTQSIIECCLHCGSVAIKKHGKTKAGIQRYICKDCGKSFSANYGLITHYSHLSDWHWKEIIRGTVEGLSLTDIAKNIGTSASTVWSCRMKIYQTIKNIYGYGDNLGNITEADGKKVHISLKGKKDRLFFIDTLERLPRRHMSRKQRIEYVDKTGKYNELLETKSGVLKEMLYSSQNKMTGQHKIDSDHQQVCILSAVDRTGNIYIEPATAGTSTSEDVYGRFVNRVSKDALFITDGHNSYKRFIREEKLSHVIVLSKEHTNGAYSMAHVNNMHGFMEKYINKTQPATKYLDLYLMMFWWLQKNKDLSGLTATQKLYDTMTGKVSVVERAKMTKVRIKDLVSRELPIDTKGFYPKCA